MKEKQFSIHNEKFPDIQDSENWTMLTNTAKMLAMKCLAGYCDCCRYVFECEKRVRMDRLIGIMLRFE